MTVGSGRRAVAIGGGTGLPRVLRCLVGMGFDTAAIVTMADDGGSSGVLRRQLGILPPGDVRKCLVALASDEDSSLAQVFQYRFAEGEGLAGHALGNLILAALTDIIGSFDAAVDVAARSLHARGRVIPSTLADVRLHGVDRTGAEVFGQARLAAHTAPVERVYLEPERPSAHPDALAALSAADVVVVGPGSLYTSLIPNFLVSGIADALRRSAATRVYVCNVANLRGETLGFDAADHAQALLDHGLAGALDVALVHRSVRVPAVICDDAGDVEPVPAGPDVVERIERMGISVITADLAEPGDPARHAREALSRALKGVLT